MYENQMRHQLLRCWYEKLEKIEKLNDLKNEHLLIYLRDLLDNKTRLAPDLPLIQNIRKNRTQSKIAHPSIFTTTSRLIKLLLQSVLLQSFCRLVTQILFYLFRTNFHQYCHKSGAWWHIGRVDAFRPEGRAFESISSNHVGTLHTRRCHDRSEEVMAVI